MNRKIILAFPLAVSLFYGCYNDNAEDLYPDNNNCDTSTTTYAAIIKPIIVSKCVTSGCHTTAAKAGGYDLSVHNDLATIANNGKLVAAIEWTGPNPMPQGGSKLDNCSITIIKRWVSKGAQNN